MSVAGVEEENTAISFHAYIIRHFGNLILATEEESLCLP